MSNLELDLLTGRAALPRSERGTTIAYINQQLALSKLRINVRGQEVIGMFRGVDATARGLMVFIDVNGQSESAPLSTAQIVWG